MTTPNDNQRLRRRDRVELARHARGLLQGLGTETTDVASALAAAGVRGLPADARQCVLAMYLRAVMEGDPRVCGVRVFHDRMVITSPGRVRQHRVVVSMPSPLRAFVAGFDAQRYPALVRQGEPGRAKSAAPSAATPGQS